VDVNEALILADAQECLLFPIAEFWVTEYRRWNFALDHQRIAAACLAGYRNLIASQQRP